MNDQEYLINQQRECVVLKKTFVQQANSFSRIGAKTPIEDGWGGEGIRQ